jgi:hypothetical protein
MTGDQQRMGRVDRSHIYLRQCGSPESKPVGAPHEENRFIRMSSVRQGHYVHPDSSSCSRASRVTGVTRRSPGGRGLWRSAALRTTHTDPLNRALLTPCTQAGDVPKRSATTSPVPLPDATNATACQLMELWSRAAL